MSNYENSTTKKESKTLNDKAFWAVYLNMARHNAYIVLGHISQKLGEKPTNEDNLVGMFCITCLTGRDSVENASKSLNFLRKHFPFLNYHEIISPKDKKGSKLTDVYSQNQTKEVYQILESFFKLLNKLRNEFTHVEAQKEPSIWEDHKTVFEDLFAFFTAAVNKTQAGPPEYTPEQVSHLRPFKGGKNRKNSAFHYGFSDTDSYTPAGLAFFICLFLEKAQAYIFLSQLGKFYEKDNNDYSIVKAAFSTFAIRLPKQRLNYIITEPICFALDMLNDLQKAPIALFEQLSDAKQKDFILKPQNNEEETIDENGHPLNLIRHQDRFPFFALNYIDQQKHFTNLYFQIDMGTFYYKIYPKQMIDNEKRTRRVGKNIKVFGRLQEMDKQRENVWGRRENEEDINKMIVAKPLKDYPIPFMTDTYPHYHISDNQIGIKIKGKDYCHLPELAVNEPTKNEPVKLPKNEQPDMFVSIYELPALIFMLYLNKKYNIRDADLSPELEMKAYRKNIHTFYKEVETLKKNYSCNVDLDKYLNEKYYFGINDISPDIKQYIQGKMTADKVATQRGNYAVRKLAALIKQTEQKLRSLENDKEYLKMEIAAGKTKWRPLKVGKLGDFLAKDMLWLQPSLPNEKGIKEGKDKLTGYNFQILQATLAQYNGQDKHEIVQMLREAKLIDSNSGNSHPFLAEILPTNYMFIDTFYKAYLQKRKAYFQKCQKEAKYNDYYFLKVDREKWKNRYAKFDNLTKSTQKGKEKLTLLEDRLLSQPVNIPRTFFMNMLKKWFSLYGNEDMKKIAYQERQNTAAIAPQKFDKNGANTIYLIQQYMLTERDGDKSQSFYADKRNYDFINKQLDTRTEDEKLRDRKKTPIKEFDTRDVTFKQEIAKIKAQFSEKDIKRLEISIGKEKDLKFKAEYEQQLKNMKYLRHNLAEINENEQKIRLYAAQDMLTLLIAEELLLAYISPTKEKVSIKEIEIATIFVAPQIAFPYTKTQKVQQLIFLPYDKDSFSTAKNKTLKLCEVSPNKPNFLGDPIKLTLPFITYKYDEKGKMTETKVATIYIQDQLKIKNYGSLKRYLLDKRISSLFLWLKPDTIVSREQLSKEFAANDQQRLKIAEVIHEFETVIAEKCKEEWKEEYENIKKEDSSSLFAAILTIFYKHYLEFETEKNTAKAIRNACFHNQYPRPEDINGVEANRTDVRGIAKEITEKGIALFQQYIDAMKG